jgi:hypothetical protein
MLQVIQSKARPKAESRKPQAAIDAKIVRGRGTCIAPRLILC